MVLTANKLENITWEHEYRQKCGMISFELAEKLTGTLLYRTIDQMDSRLGFINLQNRGTLIPRD